MANRILDLDILIPENETIIFTAKQEKKKYEIELFIPPAIGFLIIDNIEIISSIFQGGIKQPQLSKPLINILIKIFVGICKSQYENINEDWVMKNISLPRLAYIIFKLAIPIYDFLTNSGLTEATRPKKESEENQNFISQE